MFFFICEASLFAVDSSNSDRKWRHHLGVAVSEQAGRCMGVRVDVLLIVCRPNASDIKNGVSVDMTHIRDLGFKIFVVILNDTQSIYP